MEHLRVKWFDFTKTLRDEGVEDGWADDILIHVKAASERTTVGQGSKTSDILLPVFSYTNAPSDTCEISEELYETQKAHYENLQSSGGSVSSESSSSSSSSSSGPSEDAGPTEPDNNSAANEEMEAQAADPGAVKRAMEDLDFCKTADEVKRDWERFKPRYEKEDSSTYNSIYNLWNAKFKMFGGDGELDVPF